MWKKLKKKKKNQPKTEQIFRSTQLKLLLNGHRGQKKLAFRGEMAVCGVSTVFLGISFVNVKIGMRCVHELLTSYTWN